MRRTLSFLLVLVLLLLNTTVFALNPDLSQKNEGGSVTIYCSASGEWSTDSETFASTKYTTEIHADAQFEDIYISQDGTYFQKICDDTYLPVRPVVAPLSDYEAYEALKDYNVPSEVMDGIATMAAFAKENQCNDAKVTIFVSSPEVTASTQATPNTYPRSTTVWDGKTFHHYIAYFTNLWTTWQTVAEAGATTSAALNAIKTLAVTAAGFSSGSVGVAANLFSAGATCLSTWKTATGKTPVYGNINNKVMVDICYYMYLKYTYYYDPILKVDRHGCSSQCAFVSRIDTDTYLYASTGGQRVEQTVYPRQTYESPHYRYPEETAFNHYFAGVTETVRGQVYNKTILFSFPNFTWPSDWPS